MVKPITFPPSARRNRGETAVEKLRREILLGRYQPGARLPPERELSLKLGTNRNTLREAIRTLESEKLVRARQGDGTIVLDWRIEGEINLLPHFLAEETPIDERFEALYTMFRLRDALIDHALHFAVGVAKEPDLRGLRGALDELRLVESGTPAAVRADIEFYRRLVLASRATVLAWVFNTFARIFAQLGEQYPQLWTIDAAYLDALDEVVHAIITGDESEARRCMRALLELRSGVVLVQLAPERTEALPGAVAENSSAAGERPRAAERARAVTDARSTRDAAAGERPRPRRRKR